MRVCATVNAAFIGIVLAVATFAACAASSTTPASTSDSASPGATETASANGDSPPAEPAAGEPAAAQATPPKKQPQTAADCKALLTEITNNPPESGVVMNNASADAGSTRLQPMMELIGQKRDGFRCCFDIWAKDHPGVNGRVTFNFDLKPDGTLIKAESDKTESTITAPEVESCMVDLAKSLTYPKSPTGKQTTYRHRFDFKARQY